MHSNQASKGSSFAWVFCSLMLTVCLSGLAGLGFGRHGIEKLLTALVMPVGFSWLVVSTWMILSWFRGPSGHRLVATFVWAVFTLLSTGPIPSFWVHYLENQFEPYQANANPPLDYLIVLGGGTAIGPNRSQVGSNGDRVVYAAQLYLQGHCKHLITTGSASPLMGNEKPSGPTEQTIEIWTDLGIPPADISALPGLNTYEEMQSLKSMLSDFQGKRTGLLTNANHLPRALRLAESAGLTDLIPVPCNFSDSAQWRSLGFYIPSASHLNRWVVCQHEWMGSLIGR